MLKERSLIACSGGLDSVVLTHLFYQMSTSFELAHCNFQLRAQESDLDEEFVVEFAKSINRKINVKRFDTKKYVNSNNVSLQMAARDLRYSWFDQLCEEKDLNYIVTAHQADDQVETFLINLSRGTGLKGLTGIPEKAGRIRRPLLVFSREELEQFARDEKIQWREDSSNQSTYYVRNRIRHNVVPELKQLHPGFLQNFQRSLEQLKGGQLILDQYVEALKSDLFRPDGKGWKISVKSLKELNPLHHYLYALFSEYGFGEWNNLADLLNASSGKIVLSGTHRLIKDRQDLLLSPLSAEDNNAFRFELKEGQTEGPVPMEIAEVQEIGERSPGILYVDKETLNNQLEVRKWKKGDYFYPLGMQGRKLVSKYYKDEKYNALEKEQQLLLFSGEDLVWIIGKRADDRFKVRPQTKEILRFRLLG